MDSLVKLMGFTDARELQSAHKRWIEASLQVDKYARENQWTESIAVGSKLFVENVKKKPRIQSKT